jgi:hypothetical protein
MVIKPAMAILLEGAAFLAVAGILRWPARERALPVLAAGTLAFNLLWRVPFQVRYTILEWLGIGESIGPAGPAPFDFLIRDTLLSTAVMLLLLILARRSQRSVPIQQPSLQLTAGMLTLAMVAELVTRLV